MLSYGVKLIAYLADEYGFPVLLTLDSDYVLSQPLETVADEHIVCESTQFGPRFRGTDFETLVYHDRGWMQTTLAYWERVLQARHPEYEFGQANANTEVSPVGTY
jgi:hypothetical protein